MKCFFQSYLSNRRQIVFVDGLKSNEMPFQSYLSNRRQIVVVDGLKSNEMPLGMYN